MINKIGIVWGNCIMDNIGWFFEILGIKYCDFNGVLSGGGWGLFGYEGWFDDVYYEEFFWNFCYDNKGEFWLQWKV